jgi:ATP-dependent DNA ligase
VNAFFSIILDGEMLVWDPVSERNLPFGTLKTAALGKPGRLQTTLRPENMIHR